MRGANDVLRHGRRACGIAGLVVGLAGVWAGAAVGQGMDRAAMIAACRSDYAQFCREVKPGGGAILACLREHLDALSTACRAVVLSRGGAGRGADGGESNGEGQTRGAVAHLGDGIAPHSGSGMAVAKIADLAYGPSPAQRLDVYAPPAVGAGREAVPVITMVHGGAWRFGDKARGGVVQAKVDHYVPRGYVFVSIDYRLLPEADPLTQAEDVARALAFVEARAASFGGDPRRVVLMGHSAGAHLVALLAAAPEMVARAGATPALATIALDSAAYDVAAIMKTRHLPLYDQAFGSEPAAWRRVSPLDRLERAPGPMLLVCSTRRAESCAQARAFAGRVGGLGGRVEVLPVAMNHMEINRDLGATGDHTHAVDAFLASLGLP